MPTKIINGNTKLNSIQMNKHLTLMNYKQRLLVIGTFLIMIVLIVVSSTYYTTTSPTDKLQVVATFYPLALFAREIGGEKVQVTQLVPNNIEIHSWEPSVKDIAAAETADVIFYNGADLDPWIETEILPALTNSKNRTTIDTTNGLTLLRSAETEETPDEHDHGFYDPHTWVSPFMAELQAEKIYEALTKQDPANEIYYTANWLKLKKRMEQMDDSYITTFSTKQKNTIFVSHEAFGYLASRYNFTQQGLIGLSADQQPSAIAIANIINLMVKYKTYVVYVDSIYSQEYGQTLKNELETRTGQVVYILELYVATGPIDGKDYFQQQLINLENLKTGLEA